MNFFLKKIKKEKSENWKTGLNSRKEENQIITTTFNHNRERNEFNCAEHFKFSQNTFK